ncbi:MAG: thymidylate synthase [Candidatus Pacebacteria bacterium]|nr:thymidylate synthase [Candidatus Paceibacterota bacterium]
MKQYLQALQHVIDHGRTKDTRGIHPVKSTFGYQMRFDLRRGFPIVTTKKMPFKIMVNELLWFISGKTNIDWLNQHGIHYWNDFADDQGELGPVYGHQWRRWPDYEGDEIDQLKNVIEEIKTTPDSKAMIVSAWNPAQLDEMRLPPCHTFFQFNVTKGKLRLQLYQRSADAFLGLPFNISQYSLLLLMVAQVTGLEAREFIHTIGDLHIYKNHLEPAKKQLERQPYRRPLVMLNPKVKEIDDFTENDFKLINYQAHPHIAGELVVV